MEPGVPPPRRYGPSQAALALLAYLGVQTGTGIAIGVLFGVAYGATHRASFPSMAADIMARAALIGGAVGVLAGGAVSWWLARRMIHRQVEGISREALGLVRGSGRAQVAAAVAGAIIGVAFLAATLVFPLPEEAKPGWIEAIAGGGWPYYLWIVLALFIAPPVEEFVFRGMLWTGLARAWSPAAAAAAVTIAFAAIHITQAGGYLPAMLAIAAMGAAALVARVKSGSLVPPIALHLTYNAMVVMSMARGA